MARVARRSEHGAQGRIVTISDFTSFVRAQYGFASIRLDFIGHADQVYRLDTDQGRYVLRLYGADLAVEHVDSELRWLGALSRDTDLRVPTPRPTLSGSLTTSVDMPDVGGSRVAVVGWVWGERPACGDPDCQLLHRLGALAARLHDHGREFVRTGSRFVRMDFRRNFLPELRELIGSSAAKPVFGVGGERAAETIVRTTRKLEARLDGLDCLSERTPVHGDLQFGNVVLHRDGLGLIDFAMCGFLHPMDDLAHALHCLDPLRRDPVAFAERRRALLDGYADVRTLTAAWVDLVEAFQMRRQLRVLYLRLKDLAAGSGDTDDVLQERCTYWIATRLHRCHDYLAGR